MIIYNQENQSCQDERDKQQEECTCQGEQSDHTTRRVYVRISEMINQYNQHVNASSEYNIQTCIKDNDIKSSQCVINSQANKSTKRGRYPLIDQSNATFASS